jgi:hypothetical protein
MNTAKYHFTEDDNDSENERGGYAGRVTVMLEALKRRPIQRPEDYLRHNIAQLSRIPDFVFAIRRLDAPVRQHCPMTFRLESRPSFSLYRHPVAFGTPPQKDLVMGVLVGAECKCFPNEPCQSLTLSV